MRLVIVVVYVGVFAQFILILNMTMFPTFIHIHLTILVINELFFSHIYTHLSRNRKLEHDIFRTKQGPL